MKSIPTKIKKQRRPDAAKTVKFRCGTLTYMAECRGSIKKTYPVKRQVQLIDLNGIARKLPAV